MAWEARLGLKPVILALLFTILVVEIVVKLSNPFRMAFTSIGLNGLCSPFGVETLPDTTEAIEFVKSPEKNASKKLVKKR